MSHRKRGGHGPTQAGGGHGGGHMNSSAPSAIWGALSGHHLCSLAQIKHFPNFGKIPSTAEPPSESDLTYSFNILIKIFDLLFQRIMTYFKWKD